MNKKIKTLCVMLSTVLIMGTFSGCKASQPSESSTPDISQEQLSDISDVSDMENTDTPTLLNRSDLTMQLEETKAAFRQSPEDKEIAISYAQILFALGDFEPAQVVLKSFLEEESPSPDVVYLQAQIDYLHGNYKKAEELYKYLAENHGEDYGMAADAGLLMVYYQTNEYSKTESLFAGQDFSDPFIDMMKGFGNTVPYQIDWNGEEQTTIPFVVSEPLAVVPIEINGIKINAFIDNGGSTIMLDEAMAEELGVDIFSSGEGSVSGGDITFSMGKTSLLKIGDVNVRDIPVTLLSFESITEGFEYYGVPNVHASVSMNFLAQFKSVIDYPSGRIILFPRNDAGSTTLSAFLKDKQNSEEIPFTLAGTHYMFAKGSINGHAGLNLFVDCGGSNDKGISTWVYKSTMEYLEIPFPEMVSATGLGGEFEEGFFEASFGLGSFREEGKCSYDTSGHSDDMSAETGFVNDAMISYNYLKNYTWVIDFDTMTMTLCK